MDSISHSIYAYLTGKNLLWFLTPTLRLIEYRPASDNNTENYPLQYRDRQR